MDTKALAGKLHQIASKPSTGCSHLANGTRTTHSANPRINSGGTTAPVERTTPATTKVTPKNRNDHTAMWLRWRAASSAGLASGRNQDKVVRSNRISGAIS